MKYKRFKTLLLDYMEEVPKLDDIEWLYYMDIDMLMGAPFNRLVQGLYEEYDIENVYDGEEDDRTTSTLYMFKDPNSEIWAANSGFIIMNRQNSRRCLDIWREEMGKGWDFIKNFFLSVFHLCSHFSCMIFFFDHFSA